MPSQLTSQTMTRGVVAELMETETPAFTTTPRSYPRNWPAANKRNKSRIAPANAGVFLLLAAGLRTHGEGEHHSFMFLCDSVLRSGM